MVSDTIIRALNLRAKNMYSLACLIIATIFSVWVIFLGGAEILEGTAKSEFLIEYRASLWSAVGIKVYVAISWLGTLLWYVIL